MQCKTDPVGAVTKLLLNIRTYLNRNNYSDVVQYSEMCKILINKLIQKLEPAELRVRLTDGHPYWSGPDKSNMSLLMKRICILSMEVRSGEVDSSNLKRKATAGPSHFYNSSKTSDRKSNKDQSHKKPDARIPIFVR